jgi:hypothetical protein
MKLGTHLRRRSSMLGRKTLNVCVLLSFVLFQPAGTPIYYGIQGVHAQEESATTQNQPAIDETVVEETPIEEPESAPSDSLNTPDEDAPETDNDTTASLEDPQLAPSHSEPAGTASDEPVLMTSELDDEAATSPQEVPLLEPLAPEPLGLEEPADITTGTLIVRKDAVGYFGEDIVDTESIFTIALDGANYQTVQDGGSVTFADLPAGLHTISEVNMPENYNVASYGPEDADWDMDGHQVSVLAGQTTEITIINSQKATSDTKSMLIVYTNVSGAWNYSFTMHLNGGPSNIDQTFQLYRDGDIDSYSHSSGPIEPGDGYRITPEPNPGFNLIETFCYDGSPVDNISLDPGEVLTCVYTYHAMAGMNILNWHDINGDDTINDGLEPPLSNWKVYVDQDGSSSWDEGEPYAYTDGAGRATFPDLSPSNYLVCMEPDEEWLLTSSITNYCQMAVVAPGEYPTVLFANYRPITLSGTTYNDNNGNFAIDAGEFVTSRLVLLERVNDPNPPICPNGTVNGEYCEMTSDASGNYSFTDLRPGVYQLWLATQEVPDGWILAVPDVNYGGTGHGADGTYSLEALSSQSISGFDFAIQEKGSWSVTTDVAPDDGSLWHFTVTGPRDYSNVYHNLTDGGSISDSGMIPGTYTFTESYNDNYTTTIDCGVNGTMNGNSLTVTLDPGENIQCIFTNTRNMGDIVVHKNVVGPGGEDILDQSKEFSVLLDGAQQQSIRDGETVTYSNVPTGVHTISETNIPTGYQLVEITPDGNVSSAGAQFTVRTDQTAHVNITNRQQESSITVRNEITNDNGGNLGASDFPLFIDGAAVDHDSAVSVLAGSHTVSQTNIPGYQMTISGDCDNNGVVSVAPGEHKTCIITNNDIAPQLTVIKEVINDDGGSSQVSDFPLSISGTPVTSGVPMELNANTAYQVSEINLPGYTASFSGDCDSNGSITLQPGDNKVCTITNDDAPATIIVQKVINDANGVSATASDFTFMISGVTAKDGNSFSGNESGVEKQLTSIGEYTVTEESAPAYEVSYSADCSGSIMLGETKTCVVTNTRLYGTIRVHKDVLGPDGEAVDDYTAEFTVQLDSTNDKAINDKGLITYANVPVGQHTITEIGISEDYELVSITPDEDTDQDGGQITIAGGQELDVYIINKKKAPQSAHLSITKNVLDPEGQETADSHSFVVTVNGDAHTITEGSGVDLTLAPGTYTIAETADTKYDFVQILGATDAKVSEPGFQVALTAGETTALTVVNKQKKSQIVVSKKVWKAGTAVEVKDGYIFTALLDGQNEQPLSIMTTTTYSVNPGKHTISERDDMYYDELGCRLVNGQLAENVDISGNETIHVTCTNQQKPVTIVVRKDVRDKDGDDVSDNYSFTLSINGKLNKFSESSPFTMTGLPGTYNISEVLLRGERYKYQSCIADLSPSQVISNGVRVNLTSGQTVQVKCTNHQKPSAVKVIKFHDKDGNGKKDLNEKVLSNWKITLARPGVYTNAKTTSSDGWVLFTPLKSGTYDLSETLRLGWNQTNIYCANENWAIDADNTHAITVRPDEIATCYVGNTDKR